MNELVSIIVPVYNVEHYVGRCLSSLCSQTYQKIEIIVVNDGSNDNSGAVINEYAVKDKRIIVVEKENGGLSSARNAGMDVMKGYYVAFIDSDDYLGESAIEDLVKAYETTNADLVEMNVAIDCNGKISVRNDQTTTEINNKNLKEHPEYLMKIMTSSCVKLYRRSMIDDLHFPEQLIHEDEYFTSMICPRLTYFYKLEGAYGYYIYERSDSITHTLNEKIFDRLNIHKYIYSDYQKYGYLEEYKQLIEAKCVRTLLVTLLVKKGKVFPDKRKVKFFYYEVCNFIKTTYPNYKNNPYLTKKEKLVDCFVMKGFLYLKLIWKINK